MAKRKAPARVMSPIEIQLRDALLLRDHVNGWSLHDLTNHPTWGSGWTLEDGLLIHPELDQRTAPYRGPQLMSQVRIAGYFVDLFLFAHPSLAIECDGHEYHERTKQQAAYDRARDREILRHGVPTIRFTGSEIYRDADQCAREVVETWLALENQRVSISVDAWTDGHAAAEEKSKAATHEAYRDGIDQGWANGVSHVVEAINVIDSGAHPGEEHW